VLNCRHQVPSNVMDQVLLPDGHYAYMEAERMNGTARRGPHH
jgi:hypothetical protein